MSLPVSTDGASRSPPQAHGHGPAAALLYPPAPSHSCIRFDEIAAARGRRVAVLAVHHVEVCGQTLTGGAEKYLLLATRALLDAGAAVHVGYSGASIYEQLLMDYDPRRLTVERTGWLNEGLAGDREVTLRRVLERRRWLRSTRADTVFCVQQASGAAFVASLVAARSLGLRVVASLRQPPEERAGPEPGNRGGALWRRLDGCRRPMPRRRRLASACCHALIYNSGLVAESYAAQCGFARRKAAVIFNGEAVSANVAAAVRTGPPRRIGVVGRLTRAKGVDVALAAFERVSRERPDASLVFFGEGPMAAALREQARRAGLSDRVEFAGYQRDRERMYARIDVLLSASRRESMANCAVEAQVRGIPCVVTDVGGMAEAVADGETGVLTPAGDVDAMARALLDLLRDREGCVTKSHAALKRAREIFDVHAAMRRTVKAVLGL